MDLAESKDVFCGEDYQWNRSTKTKNAERKGNEVFDCLVPSMPGTYTPGPNKAFVVSDEQFLLLPKTK